MKTFATHEFRVYLLASVIFSILLIALFALLMISEVVAHDSRHPENNEWLKNLRNNDKTLCCDGTDYVHLKDPDWKIVGTHYEVFLDGQWHIVKEEAVVSMKNIDGIAKVWPTWEFGKRAIRCFQPGSFS